MTKSAHCLQRSIASSLGSFRRMATGVLLLTIGNLVAQRTGDQAVYFSNLSTRAGLPSNIIAAIAQDQYDFIWVGTGSGLARYDGYTFKIFKRTESENSLTSNELSTLLTDGEWLWVGTWQGLCKIHTRTFEVVRIPLGNTGPVRALFKGADGILWIGTGNGLIQYSPNDGASKTFTTQSGNLSHNTIRTIYADEAGRLWVGTYDGLTVMEPGKQTFTPVLLKRPEAESSKNHLILDIKPANDQTLWIGTETGLFKLDKSAQTSTKILPKGTGFINEVIKCIYTNSGEKLWLGTDFGLNILNPKTLENEVLFHDPQVPYSIPNNVIWQIFEDRSGVVWLVTSNGLSRINKAENFYRYVEVTDTAGNQRTGNQVKSILADGDVYWLGTLHGVSRIQPGSPSKKVFDTDSKPAQRILLNNVFALEKDDLGNLWIGTAGGINIWDGKQMQEITASEENGLNSNYIARFVKGPDNQMWVGVWEGGVFRISGTISDLKFEQVDGLVGSEKVATGPSSIWVIEYDELYEVNPVTLQKTHIPAFSQSSGKQMIYCIYVSSSGVVWGGSLNGLVSYDPNQKTASFHSLKTGNDLIVSSIIEDEEGNIWSASSTSIQKLAQDSSISYFPLDPGLPIKSFYYGCAARTPSGEILFGGDNGFLIFDPKKAQPNHFKPPVYITSILINNKEINVGETISDEVLLNTDIAFTEELELDFGRRSLTLEFSSLHFWQPGMSVYSYRMEGLDKNWNQVSGMKNFAVYSSLPSGTYTFQVKATNNYGKESPDIASLKIRIKPPLYFSPLFILLYIVVSGALIFYGLQFYTTRVHLKNELKITRMEKEHAEEIERTKEQFFTNISHELRTPISLILPPLHEVQKTGRLNPHDHKLIELAEKNSNRLLRLVDQILDFNKIEHELLDLEIQPTEIVGFCREIVLLFNDQAVRHQINLSVKANPESLLVWVDQKKIETVLFNLLSNAFKFTPDGGAITVVIHKKDETRFILEVHDTGLGIPEEEKSKVFERFYQTESGKKLSSSSGIGLTLSREYVTLHAGTIEVATTSGEGTRFIITLPIGSEASQATFMPPAPQTKLRDQIKGSLPAPVSGHRPTLLLVEDNDDIIDFIRVSLETKYIFEVANNGEEGLRKAKDLRPELIISDIMMPVMDGLRMTELIKSNPDTSHIMVIMLTAKALPSNQLEGIRRGADIYLTKPFEIELLEAHIGNLLKRKEELNTYFKSLLVSGSDDTDATNNQDNRFLKKVMDIIEANMGESEFGVEEIAKEMAMSPTHLYRKLKAITNHSPMEILKKYRVKKASLLLGNNEGNVSEVMYKVGFSSLSYFSKCFREEFGMTPKEYQKKQRP